MNKIGFRIYRFKEGPSIGLTVNEGDWTKKVVDIRDILKLYNSEDETKFAIFMSFSETGAYLTIARLISGRGGDNTAAWIYIPNSIEVTGAEIIPIIEVVKEELSASKSNTERLTNLFSKEYNAIEVAAFLPSSSEKAYAKRDVGFYPLKDLIGVKRYQPIYSNYNAILLNDRDTMEIVEKNVTDLTDDQLVETLVFCPPVKQDIPVGVTVHFNATGYPLFNKPVRVNRSTRINLVFMRDGFENIPFMDSVEENNQICGIPPRFDWKVTISKNQFRVLAAHDSGKDLTNDARIYINGIELSWNRVMQLSEREATQATIKVAANGYETRDRQVNLLNSRMPISFELHRAEREQTWRIELANGEYADMTLKSKHLTPRYAESPLKGYSLGERNNSLEYTNYGVLKQRAIGFLMAIATGIIICLCVALYDWYDTHTFTWQFGWPLLKTEKISNNYSYYQPQDAESTQVSTEPSTDGDTTDTTVSAPTIEDAIKYLDNDAGKWQRDSIIKYQDLDGLFEELNTYQFSKILNRYSQLKDSKNFKMVYDAIRINQGKPFSGNFCGDGDYTITVQNYINKLNKPVEQVQAPANGGVVSEAANKAQKSSKAATSKQNNGDNNTSKDKKNKRGGV